MDAAMVEVLGCNVALILSGMKVMGRKLVDEYTCESFMKCTRYAVMILEDEFGVRHDFFAPLTDGYTIYRFFAELNEENERALRWAHVRAKFKLASKKDIWHN